MTGKERAEIRSQANTLDTTVIVGKNGITENLISDISIQLEARELLKCKVLETALLTAREACDAICEATGAEPIQVVGYKFVIYKKSNKPSQEKQEKAKKVNPVKVGIKRRRAAMNAERERRNDYFRKQAIEASIERSKAAKQKRNRNSQ